MLSIELLLLVDKSEEEDIVILGLEVSNALNILGVVVKLHPDVEVLSLLNLHNHEHIFIVLFDSVCQLTAAQSISVVFNHTLDVSLTGNLVLVILIEIVAPALHGDFLGGHLLAVATILVTHDHTLLLGQ